VKFEYVVQTGEGGVVYLWKLLSKQASEKTMATESEKKWFERTRPDGGMEPHVTVSDDGCILVLDSGWAASFKDGKWTNKIMFEHDELSEFTPVTDQKEIYRILSVAREALKVTLADTHPVKE
jgi:hypothetical protein